MTPSSSTQVHLSREGAPFNPALLAEARLGSMQEFKDALGWTPSGRIEHVWVDIRHNVHNVRDLRSILLTLAYVAQAASTCEVLCILQLSRITQNRLDAELLNLRGLLGPGGDRVHVVLGFAGTPLTLPALLEQANMGPALAELIAEKRLSPKVPVLWVHGHVHHNFDYRVGKCRVVCNPRGHFRGWPGHLEAENEAFDPAFVVEI